MRHTLTAVELGKVSVVHNNESPWSETFREIIGVFVPQNLFDSIAGEVLCIKIVGVVTMCLPEQPRCILNHKLFYIHHIDFECSNLLRKRVAYSLSLRSSLALLCIRSMVASMSDERLYRHLRIDANSLMIRSHFCSMRRIRLSYLVITLGFFKSY